MSLIDVEKADLLTLDPGEIYIAGRYNSLVPIMAERYGPGSNNLYLNFFNILVYIWKWNEILRNYDNGGFLSQLIAYFVRR